MLDRKDDRLEKTKEFGADIVWNPSKVNVVEEIMKLADDVVFRICAFKDWETAFKSATGKYGDFKVAFKF